VTPEQCKERIVDYLYGELSGDDLAAFEACLQTSEACRREVEALQQTLGLTRRALSEPLASEPPTRYRSALLAAAEAAARAGAATEESAHEARRQAALSHAEAAARSAHPERDDRGRTRRGLWAWLAEPWMFPALGVASAFVVWAVLEGRELNAPSHEAPPVASAPDTLAEAERDDRARYGQVAVPRNERPAPGASAGAASSGASGAAARREPRPAAAPTERSDDPWDDRERAEPTSRGGRVVGAAAPSKASRVRKSEAPGAEAKSSQDMAAPLPPAAPAAAAPRAAEAEAAPAADAVAKGGDASREARVLRARELVDAGERARAIEAYRALLRDHADDARADAWRRTLRALEQAGADAGAER